MKVILPVIDDGAKKESLADGFHNADYACVYDCEAKEYEWMPTTEISEKATFE